jgi:hypothetical protein
VAAIASTATPVASNAANHTDSRPDQPVSIPAATSARWAIPSMVLRSIAKPMGVTTRSQTASPTVPIDSLRFRTIRRVVSSPTDCSTNDHVHGASSGAIGRLGVDDARTRARPGCTSATTWPRSAG